MNWSELVSLSTNTTFSQWCRSAPWAGLLFKSINGIRWTMHLRILVSFFVFRFGLFTGFHICRYWHASRNTFCIVLSVSEIHSLKKKFFVECRLWWNEYAGRLISGFIPPKAAFNKEFFFREWISDNREHNTEGVSGKHVSSDICESPWIIQIWNKKRGLRYEDALSSECHWFD